VALLCEGHVVLEDVPAQAKPCWRERWQHRWASRSAAFNTHPTFCPTMWLASAFSSASRAFSSFVLVLSLWTCC